MIKQTVTYTDWDNQTKTDDLYFNLTKAELAELEIVLGGNVKEQIERMIKQTIDENGEKKLEIDPQYNARIFDLFKIILAKAYGEKNTDGRFVKSKDISNSFLASEAFSEFFMTVIMDPEKSEAFFNGILPKKDAVNA